MRGDLRDRIARAIQNCSYSREWLPVGPYAAQQIAEAVVAELGQPWSYCNRCGIPHDAGKCGRVNVFVPKGIANE